MPDSRRKHIYSAVKESLFEELVKPLLTKGGELPSKKELAIRYDVNIGTLDKALQELAIEGYIEKRMGSGTYVLPQEKKRGEAGVLLGAWRENERERIEFNFKLDAFIQERLLESGKQFRHYADLRMKSLRCKPLPQLLEDIEARKISALIVNGEEKALSPWLEQLKIPVFALNHDYGWGTVSVDMKSGGFEAAKALAEKGCKRIELVSALVHEWEDRSEIAVTNRPIRAGMANALRPAGIRAPECWLVRDMLPESLRDSSGFPEDMPDVEKGRLLCKTLLANASPDGLAVYTDLLAKGVLETLKEAKLEIPVAVLGNKEIDFPWLKGQERIDISLKDAAAGLVELLDAAGRGEPPREIYLPYKRRESAARPELAASAQGGAR